MDSEVDFAIRALPLVLGLEAKSKLAMAVEACIREGTRGRTANDVAGLLGKSSRTLRGWMQDNNLPPPARLMRWGRLLVSLKHLEDGETVRKAAEEVKAHFTWLSNTTLRELGCRPTDWVKGGADFTVLPTILVRRWEAGTK